MLSLATGLAVAAIITQNNVPLQAGPTESSAQNAVLTQGDMLEIRGRKLDYFQVYDHRRERAGYVLATKVRTSSLDSDDAPALANLLSYVQHQPGQEALTISLAFAHLKASSRLNQPHEKNQQAESAIAIGDAVHRLIDRVQKKRASDLANSQLEAVRFLGVKTHSFEVNGQQRLCYAGESYAQALNLATSSHLKAQAALGLTRGDCLSSDLPASVRRTMYENWLATISQVKSRDTAQSLTLSELSKNQLRLREALIRAELAIATLQVEPGDSAKSVEHASQAIALLASINKAELSDSAKQQYQEAGARVGAVRWAAVAARAQLERGGLNLKLTAGEPGQTCLQIADTKALPGSTQTGVHGKRCTYGRIWLASLAVAPQGHLATVAVQQSASWRELWILRKDQQAWTVDVLVPATELQEVGLVEFAGFAGKQILIAREVVNQGKVKTSFETISVDSLDTLSKASSPSLVAGFARHQDPAWKASTLTLR